MKSAFELIRDLEQSRAEQRNLMSRLEEIKNAEVEIKELLVSNYKSLKEYCESQGLIEKESIPQLHFAKSPAAKAIEEKANAVISDVYTKKATLTIINEDAADEEADKEVSKDMEKASTVFHRRANECANIAVHKDMILHRAKPLYKLDVPLQELFTTIDFDNAFSWTNIKLIKINGLYISGDDLTGIIRNILRVILRNKPLDRLKVLRKGAQILNKTIEAMESSKVNYIRDNPNVVTIKGSSGNKVKGLVYILRCTNHIDMVDGMEFYTTRTSDSKYDVINDNDNGNI